MSDASNCAAAARPPPLPQARSRPPLRTVPLPRRSRDGGIKIRATPPSTSLGRRVVAWCKSSWSWLISAGIHALATCVLTLFSTGSERELSSVIYVLDTQRDTSDEVAPTNLPTKLEIAAVADSVMARRSVYGVVRPSPVRLSESTVPAPPPGSGQRTTNTGPVAEARRMVNEGNYFTREIGAGTKFFGIEATGHRFVFVVDSSGSMKWAKWKRACRELVAAVKNMNSNQSFCVVFFDSVPHLMFNQHPNELKLIEASPRNILRLRRWMTSISFGKATLPYQAVRQAVALRPDAVFLLSDGEFHDSTLAFVRGINPDNAGSEPLPRIIVHTIGFHSRAGQAMLQQIADETGGTYRFVP
jgi:hypothetical protein